MQNKLNVPAIIAGIFTAIVIVFDLIALFQMLGSLDNLDNAGSYGFVIIAMFIAIILVTAGYIEVAVGLFTDKKETTQKGFLMAAGGIITDFASIILLLAVSDSLKNAF